MIVIMSQYYKIQSSDGAYVKGIPTGSETTDLRAKRILDGITQARLARAIGVTQQYLSAVEQGKRKPTKEWRNRAEEALNYLSAIEPSPVLIKIAQRVSTKTFIGIKGDTYCWEAKPGRAYISGTHTRNPDGTYTEDLNVGEEILVFECGGIRIKISVGLSDESRMYEVGEGSRPFFSGSISVGPVDPRSPQADKSYHFVSNDFPDIEKIVRWFKLPTLSQEAMVASLLYYLEPKLKFLWSKRAEKIPRDKL